MLLDLVLNFLKGGLALNGYLKTIYFYYNPQNRGMLFTFLYGLPFEIIEHSLSIIINNLSQNLLLGALKPLFGLNLLGANIMFSKFKDFSIVSNITVVFPRPRFF
jgi:hypothetical protein